MICATGKNGQIELATVHATAEYSTRLPVCENAALFGASPEMARVLADALDLNLFEDQPVLKAAARAALKDAGVLP
jgi:hypothetical protein